MEDLKGFAVDQVMRLGVFREFGFQNTAAVKEYRKWLETKCVKPERIQALMDAAVELDAMPTIADLNRLYLQVFPEVLEASPALTDEEKQARAEYLRDWYAQEAREAQARRDRAKGIPQTLLTEEQILALVAEAQT